MLFVSLWLILFQVRQFQVIGEAVSVTKRPLEWAQIESIDRRFVDYTDIDINGKFKFKKVPEGIYKINVAQLIDRAKGAGVYRIGLMTEQMPRNKAYNLHGESSDV